MTDHQQAAIEAAEDALRADQWDGDPEDLPGSMTSEAEIAVAAAEPHLRKKWAEEIRNGVNPTDTGEMQEWRLGFITGVLRTARFLERSRKMSADVPRGACLQCEQVGQLSYVQGNNCAQD